MRFVTRAAGILMLSALALTTAPRGLADTPVAVEPARLQAHIEFLAADELLGRDTGTPGYDVAARYVASQFRQLGLLAAGENGSYFQEVPLVERTLAGGSAAVGVKNSAGVTKLEYLEDFVMSPGYQRPQEQVTADAVFVGYGIVSPRFDHDDYAGLDVEGKIVVVLSGRPASWPSEEGAHLSSGTEKARHAAERGAVGLVSLHTPRRAADFPWALYQRYAAVPSMSWVGQDGIPDGYHPQLRGSASLSMEAAEPLFADAPRSATEVFEADNAQEAIRGFALNARLTLERETRFRELRSPNVAGVIRGNDPQLRDEYLVYTAHLDHLGVVKDPEEGADHIYNGALDNAAGVATLLETARVLRAEQDQLRRSVLFLTVTAEEKGLLGAAYFASHPTVPTEALVANVNLDMPLFLYPFADVVAFGAEHSTLKTFVDRAAASADITLSPDPMPEQFLFVRSDHYELVKRGVPAVFLVTGFQSRDPEIDGAAVFGQHLQEHYHQPSDDTSLPLDYDVGALFTQININIGREVCNTTERPRWNEGDFFGDTFATDK